MGPLDHPVSRHRAYLTIAAIAVVAATLLLMSGTGSSLPVLGRLPLLPSVIVSAGLGLGALVLLDYRERLPQSHLWTAPRGLFVLAGLGALLALPPVAIDLALRFPRDLNLPLPDALFFYPAIAVVAEVQFHLIPLALLALIVPRWVPVWWIIAPVILVEPLFQVAYLSGPTLQALLVLGNVTLISAVQLWLFQRYGFAAMFGLRIAFYLFWHILWGSLRLTLLF
ncbi:hypothetical protein FTO60_08065 [Octadecabacter sp. SW4]|uniref:hypothetical protein n=1 Tax=Octadecabacter sp. SW4 TaxID=2602067 RepID=UPI0011C1D8CE|nr:hypothetical protein [Octadecabacter sp. SW4]QEE35665.1 hypothetical protein FTO60_08065 [Octadecabacter sp. SW4]